MNDTPIVNHWCNSRQACVSSRPDCHASRHEAEDNCIPSCWLMLACWLILA
jgi:hypothetical protein